MPAPCLVCEGHFSFNLTQNNITKWKITRKLLCELSIIKGNAYDVLGAGSILACIRYD